ncbi:serine/threonine-protein kinase RsbW [Curtobacterium sp. PhB172]|uniref:ATP-binding protein n=1 Tax=Curtobacterium TaxID=2034 RepID=UPI000FC082D6|nr:MULTISPECIES: ATP-binding protein [Curtobacterium]MBT1624187.1 ATP-binding protein [Curtobacterium flaccumfaciens pv. oortii]ROQ17423.1 serine/threonine-protein kinase RsbW [Curtobacterium sp. PhB171]ROQ29332.1 serine/threonine-protein kinase RsbW [Curtobacterium sp. PhB170]ROS45522.1 serine/threonine-protein kinase RsbW [Curtobacterium sp. PhB131]ROS60448.1 serine/threonine-protein kinase RsbW [Curtobacterium sp. PhB172]
MNAETTFDVAATPVSLDEVQDRFGAWWDGLGIDDVRLRFALETALAEVAANIVEHTARSDQETGRRYTVRLESTERALTAELTDNGLPVDIDLSAVTMADVEQESGRGLALAIAALDRLEHRHEHGHNVWTLVCDR